MEKVDSGGARQRAHIQRPAMNILEWRCNGYQPIPCDQLWWCNSHQRRATARRLSGYWEGEVCCAPNLGGIMIPCRCVNLTGIAEIIETPDFPCKSSEIRINALSE